MYIWFANFRFQHVNLLYAKASNRKYQKFKDEI